MSKSEEPSSPNRPQASIDCNPEAEPAASGNLREMGWQNRELNLTYVPDRLPINVPQPKYSIGDRCRWIPMTTADWGTIIGQVFAPIEPIQLPTPQWSWLYLVLLDSNSPSRRWVATDWAEEGDLERFTLQHDPPISEELQ